MKTLRLVSAFLGIVAAGSLRAGGASDTATRVDVVFDHPENFSDIRDSDPPTDKGQAYILHQFRDFLVSDATPLVPEGYKLTLTFTDIHLAGDYQPWRHMAALEYGTVRIVKDIYPPSFKFTYSVTDPSGAVVKKGSEEIRDMAFMYRTVLDTSDTLRYEKDILNDWVRFNLKGLKKG